MAPGICSCYYIERNVIFPTQIVVTGELESKTHIWLKALSEEIDEQDMRELIKNVKQFTGAYDRELASSVLEVSAEANRQVIKKLIGEDSMSQILMELMESQLLLREKKGWKKEYKEQLMSFGIWKYRMKLYCRSFRRNLNCPKKRRRGIF